MINEQTYHLINEYLSGELKGRELDKFKSELKSNEELRNALSSQEEIIASIRTFRENELKKKLQDNLNKSRSFTIGKSFKMALASAAVISLLVSAFFVLRPLIQSSGNITSSESTNSDDVYSPDESSNSNNEEITAVDTQTLAIAENNKPEILLDVENEAEATEEDEITDDNVESEEIESEEGKETLEDAMPKKAILKSADLQNDPDDDAIQDYVVKSDVLLSNKKYRVTAISPNFVTSNETTVAARRADSKSKDSEKAEIDDNLASKTPSSNNTARTVEVEHWKSVVNYKGYNYDGSKIKLYGVSDGTNLEFKELDNRLYLKIEGKQYFVEKTKDYKRLVEVTNPTLLNVLND